MQLIETFRTTRLIATRLREEDFGELVRMHRDLRFMAALGGLRCENETQQFLCKNLDHWSRHGYGLWVFRDQTDGRFVSRGGLRNVYVGGNEEVELAYALRAEYWGLGLATEMALAILQVGFQQLGIQDVVCFTLTTNSASQRVMEKVGFRYERDLVHADLPHVLYRITAFSKK